MRAKSRELNEQRDNHAKIYIPCSSSNDCAKYIIDYCIKQSPVSRHCGPHVSRKADHLNCSELLQQLGAQCLHRALVVVVGLQSRRHFLDDCTKGPASSQPQWNFVKEDVKIWMCFRTPTFASVASPIPHLTPRLARRTRQSKVWPCVGQRAHTTVLDTLAHAGCVLIQICDQVAQGVGPMLCDEPLTRCLPVGSNARVGQWQIERLSTISKS